MKTIIPDQDGLNDKIKFPVMARSRDNRNLIVIFSSQEVGVSISEVDEFKDRLYTETDGWIPVSNTLEWEILPKGYRVILEQT